MCSVASRQPWNLWWAFHMGLQCQGHVVGLQGRNSHSPWRFRIGSRGRGSGRFDQRGVVSDLRGWGKCHIKFCRGRSCGGMGSCWSKRSRKDCGGKQHCLQSETDLEGGHLLRENFVAERQLQPQTVAKSVGLDLLIDPCSSYHAIGL